MNSSANKGTQDLNAQKQMETRVETLDYQSSVGQGQEQRPVEIIHQQQTQVSTPQSNTSGGVLANAAASVASTLESAKRAISRK
ncbi:hypothetical protein BC332_05547 [Capsicum chinense]|uniref:Uncharacterized protein n=1 Tax=Capsicum annuum TaxID=4072 RepID=A0A2G3A823_CAPAN|nr:putative microtubule binding protein [Capsicum annuum]KAF3645820.1 putative microtubule binding protein [Capsicum annuum]PHT90340.1 hypothetical protein T459_05453 [Capsicum annuum]PHU27215.1 hypothetical protein BC332_05547 [Capsicum chinense]